MEAFMEAAPWLAGVLAVAALSGGPDGHGRSGDGRP